MFYKGLHEIEFNGNNLTEGLYLYKIESKYCTKTGKMVLTE